jgi:V8-like Glu-specific endopeptidase
VRSCSPSPRALTLALAIGATIGALGCQDVADSAPPPDVDDLAVIAGKASTAAQNAVVLLRIGEDALCTGTLVAQNLVLTARHCVSLTDEAIACAPSGDALVGGDVGPDRIASDIVVLTGTRANALHERARGARIVHDKAKNLCNHDLAFVVLDRPVTGTPLAALRTTESTRVGERVTAVGWGLTEDGVLPRARLQRTAVTVLDVGPSRQSASTQFVVGEAICSGDSGGPALAADGALIGVVSYGGNGDFDPKNPAGGCLGPDARNVYSRVAAFSKLVRTAFAAAGAKVQLEPE